MSAHCMICQLCIACVTAESAKYELIAREQKEKRLDEGPPPNAKNVNYKVGGRDAKWHRPPAPQSMSLHLPVPSFILHHPCVHTDYRLSRSEHACETLRLEGLGSQRDWLSSLKCSSADAEVVSECRSGRRGVRDAERGSQPAERRRVLPGRPLRRHTERLAGHRHRVERQGKRETASTTCILTASCVLHYDNCNSIH